LRLAVTKAADCEFVVTVVDSDEIDAFDNDSDPDNDELKFVITNATD